MVLDPTRPLDALPKAHLHLHLEGAMRLSTLAELSARNGTVLSTVPDRYGDFSAFMALYLAATRAIRSFDDLRRLVREVVEDAAADGAVWIEPAVHVPNHLDLGTHEEVLETILDEAADAGSAAGVGVGLMLTVNRTLGPELAIDQAQLAARFRDHGVVALGLANDEAFGPPEDFTSAFSLAREAGLLATPHAGEHRGADSVRGALETLGAARIQHGVRAVEDAALVERLATAGVCLDVCPTSNVALGVVASLDAHPLRRLLEAGVACSLNADDPLLFGVGIGDEYRTARGELGLGDEQLAALARASLVHSAAPETLREGALARIEAWLAG